MAEARAVDPMTALALVCVHLAELGTIRPQSRERIAHDMTLFVGRLKMLGVDDLRDVTQRHVIDFMDEAVRVEESIFRDPALGTKHFRRAAVRLLFKTARALGLCDLDPTLDVDLPRKTERAARPLVDEEVLAGELASLWSLDLTRLSAAWALGEATAVSSEIATVRITDVDVAGRRVWLAGPAKRTPRWGPLTEWGAEALRRRIEALGADNPDPRLVFRGDDKGKSGQSAVCSALHEVLVLAGLHRDPDVRPMSLSVWAGVKEFERTGQIEKAARVLGLTSLDRAARAIGWGWQS